MCLWPHFTDEDIRLRETKYLAQGYKTSNEAKNLNLSQLNSKPDLLASTLYANYP